MAAQQQVVRVKVPQGATVGSTVQATLPNGQQVKVQLPPGVVPGQVLSIAVQAAASPRTTQNLPPQAASNGSPPPLRPGAKGAAPPTKIPCPQQQSSQGGSTRSRCRGGGLKICTTGRCGSCGRR